MVLEGVFCLPCGGSLGGSCGFFIFSFFVFGVPRWMRLLIFLLDVHGGSTFGVFIRFFVFCLFCMPMQMGF